MNPAFLIGVDGGGSGTRVRLCARDGAVLGAGEAGASGLAAGPDNAWRNIALALQRAWESARRPAAPLQQCAIGLGMAGAHVASRRQIFLDAAPAFGLCVLDTDSFAALMGAHAGQAGVLLASGTGSVGEVLRRDGSRMTVSGWGFPVGDEGSGARLGLGAVGLAQQAADGRMAAGALARAVWQQTGTTREAMLEWCARAGQRDYARLAPLVFDAEAADPLAHALLADALAQLQAVVAALDPAADLPVAVHGSIGKRLQARLDAPLLRRCVQPAGDAMDGALWLVRHALMKEDA